METIHLSMTGQAGQLVYHLECGDGQNGLDHALAIAQANRGPEAIAITNTDRQCHACRIYGAKEPVQLHETPHRY